MSPHTHTHAHALCLLKAGQLLLGPARIGRENAN